MNIIQKAASIAAPKAPIKPKFSKYHNHQRQDDYAWLRALNWQEVLKDPNLLPADIRDYLEKENNYYQEVMLQTTELQENLFQEMKGRIKEKDQSVPKKYGNFLYGSGFAENSQYPYFFRITATDGIDGQQIIYLNGEDEQKDKSYFAFGGVEPNPQHQLCVWGYDHTGSEYYTLKVRSFETGKDLDDQISATGGYAVWDQKGHSFYYTKLDNNHRPSHVYRHVLGENSQEDEVIFSDNNPSFFINLSGSKLDDYIFININDHESSEVWLMPATGKHKPQLIRPREPEIEYSIKSGRDKFFILTNVDGAKNFKIMTCPHDNVSPQAWTDLIPHQADRLILTFDVTKDFLCWLERQDGLPRIVIHNRHDGTEHTIAFQEETYDLTLIGTSEYDSPLLRFSYSSMTTPSQIFDYHMHDHSRKLLKEQQIPSGHNPENYHSRRIMAPAEDGTLVPISLVYHKDTKLDGQSPCFLYGYGSYGITIPAAFNSNIFSLLDRGFVYAIAHIRGGQDKGMAWYEDGKKLNKKNTFTDFIAAGRYLVQQNFTNHKKLIAMGGSAGGLLMGAVANMAPDDYLALIALVPFVDTLNTILDDTLPLTPPEWTEWGNPILNKDVYDYMLSYSPYDQIKSQDYPAILAIGGLTDPRVTYWEPAKWVAKLRAIRTNSLPILLKTNMEGGHGGASGRFVRLREYALVYSFALAMLED